MTDDYSVEEADEPSAVAGYRTYEVYQRERVGETTNLANPRDLITDDYLADPFRVPAVLRENYPCYRDWIGNRFWITRYDDVTSIFADDANYESRPVGLAYGAEISGIDHGGAPGIDRAWVELHDEAIDVVLSRMLDSPDHPDDLVAFMQRLLTELHASVLGTGDTTADILQQVELVKAGAGWDERARIEGIAAFRELRKQLAAHLAPRRQASVGDLLSAFADLGAGSDDVARSLIEADLATLPASLANLWCLLLTHPDQFAAVKAEPRLMKVAYLEALRHSPPIATADRFARHEVERFGRLLPQGALLHLSAAAANRDPRQFANPDDFDITRKDLCHREPRGQYRADGLPAGITFGHGKPSQLPAVPRDAPRSRYALTRDLAVAVSLAILERFPDLRLADGVVPTLSLDRLGGTYRCAALPIELA